MIAVITAFHMTTLHHLLFWHEILGRLYYIPVIFAGFWFGRWGGIIAAILVCDIFLFHLIYQLRIPPSQDLNLYLELLLYIGVGIITGQLSSALMHEKDKSEEAARKLAESYDHLEKNIATMKKMERLSTIGEMAAGIAHEIRNPLQSIKGTAQILESDYPKDNRKYDMMKILTEEIERLNNLVNDVLLFAKPREPEKVETNITDLVRRAAAILQPDADNLNIILTLQLQQKFPPLQLDTEQIRQVLLNLIQNAIQNAASNVKISASYDNNYLIVQIHNDGADLPTDESEKIFTPFYSTRPGGTGLGLPISLRIMEAHGGRITITSPPEGGTSFLMWFPLKK